MNGRCRPRRARGLLAQVELQHPVVAAGLGVEHGPDGLEVGDAHGVAGGFELGVEAGGAAVPGVVEVFVERAGRGCLQPVEEGGTWTPSHTGGR